MEHHPAAPWNLQGRALVAAVRLPRERARPPAPLHVLAAGSSVLALLVAARYRPGSTLVYDELVLLVPVRYGARIGVSVQAIWVDDRQSVAGGRTIWALPKSLARFAWTEAGGRCRVVVDAGGGEPVRLAFAPAGPAVPAPLRLPVLTVRAGAVERFTVRLRGRVRRARLREVELPGAGARPLFGAVVEELRAVVDAPRPVRREG